jgi:hypothetical protein
MRTKGRWLVLGVTLSVLLATPLGLWISLTLKPRFYRNRVALPPEKRLAEAKRFVRGSLQLRNDIYSEPRWQAVFSDQEVNAWLAEDLVQHFADQIPAGVHDPMIAFESDRVTLAFEMDEGPIRSVISIVVRVDVPEGNLVALTIEKIHAGVVPLPATKFIPKITEEAEKRGLEVAWRTEDSLPVALIRYRPELRRRSIVLEDVQILDGQIRLAGRSSSQKGTVATTVKLPKRKVLQSTFPVRRIQDSPPPPPAEPLSVRESSISPENLPPRSRA